MIGYLCGTVAKVSEKEILVQTSSGVGYSVFPAGSLLASAKIGENLECEILTIVRETEISLYGFGDEREKKLFQKLLNVSGIGPKGALGIVSTPLEAFLAAVEKGDVDYLKKMPGLGKKTAEKIIIELRGKLDLAAGEGGGSESAAFGEAVQALENLGYDARSIRDILQKCSDANQKDTEDLVKYFLSSRG